MPNTHKHDRSLSQLGTSTSIKSGGVELALTVRFPGFVKALQ